MTEPANTPLTMRVTEIADGDRGYVVQKWIEEHHFSSKVLSRLPFAMYRATIGEQIKKLVNEASIVAAYSPDSRVLGWLAYTPGRHIAAVHFAYTRRKLSMPDGTEERCRRRGVFAELLDAAGVGKRFVFTHHGAMKKHGTGVSGVYRVHPPNVDEGVVAWLRTKGITAVYVPYSEWSTP